MRCLSLSQNNESSAASVIGSPATPAHARVSPYADPNAPATASRPRTVEPRSRPRRSTSRSNEATTTTTPATTTTTTATRPRHARVSAGGNRLPPLPAAVTPTPAVEVIEPPWDGSQPDPVPAFPRSPIELRLDVPPPPKVR